MKYQTLGNTDLNISVIGLGTFQLAGSWGQIFQPADVFEIMGAAEDVGVNFLDTAECYGNHLSEQLIGNSLNSARRKHWIIATKFGHQHNADGSMTDLWSASDVTAQLDASLNALQMDYIDLYQFHSGDDAAFDNDDLWRVLGDAKSAGKIRHFGLSIRNAAVLENDLHQIEMAKARGITTLQMVYNRLFPDAADKALPFAQKQGLGVIGRIPLAKGYLAGTYGESINFAESDHRSQTDVARHRDLVRSVQRFSSEIPHGVTMAQWALAWALKHPAITAVIPGARNAEQVRSNAAAAEINLSAQVSETAHVC